MAIGISNIFKKSHELTIKKTQANCLLTLKHNGYYLDDVETVKCHDSFAKNIEQLLSSDTKLSNYCIVDKKLSVNLLIDFYIEQEFKHGIHYPKQDICNQLENKILNTLSSSLKNKISSVSVKIIYSPAIEEGYLAIQVGNNSFHGSSEDISIRVTRLFENSKDSDAFIVGYKQQPLIALDSFLLETDIPEAAKVLQDGFIGFTNEIDELENNSQVNPVTTIPNKDWHYKWTDNEILFVLKDGSEDNSETILTIKYLVEFYPSILSDTKIELSEKEDNVPEITIEDNDILPISKEEPKKVVNIDINSKRQRAHEGLTSEVTIPPSKDNKEDNKPKRVRQSEGLQAAETFKPLEPTLSLVLESIVTKGEFINKYGIKHVETDRLNGRQQTPTNTAFIEMGIENLWQVNDNVNIKITSESNLVFGRTSEELDSLNKYQAVNTSDDRFPLARYGLSREHLNISKLSESTLKVSTFNTTSSIPAYIISEQTHSVIKDNNLMKEDDRLIVGLFIFKLIYKR